MAQSNPSSRELLESAIAQKKYPPFLYKYASLTSSIRFLNNHACYFSPFYKFNDPYEGRYEVQKIYARGVWEQHFVNSMHMQPSEAKNAADKMLRVPTSAAIELRNNIQEELNKSGIFCLSVENDNILLWSYYAQNHKGLCIEFSILEDADFFVKHKLLKVNYDDDYPIIDFFRHRDSIPKAILHKAKCWEHEREWRMIVPRHADAIDEIKSEVITSIILGYKNGQCETQEEFDQFDVLINILQQPHYSHVRMKQELLSGNNFRILIKDASVIARIYKSKLKITALQNTSFFFQRRRHTLHKWDTRCFDVEKGSIIIRLPNYEREFVSE